MTLFIALTGMVLALFGFIVVLVNPPGVSRTPEDEWNRAVRNLRREWGGWKLNRQEEDKRLVAAWEQEFTAMKNELAKHIRTAHLEDYDNVGTENRDHLLDEPPIDRDYRGTIGE